jgi:sulfonate transport system permease protein
MDLPLVHDTDRTVMAAEAPPRLPGQARGVDADLRRHDAGGSPADARVQRAAGLWPGACLGLVIPLAGAVAWELAVRHGLASGRLIPPPSRLAQTAAVLARSGELQTHMLATMGRVGLGFAIGAAAGTALGMLNGASGMALRLLDPSVQALRAIPSIAWVPLFILWLGIFETSKLALIALGVFFPVYLGLLTAIQSVDRKLIEVGRVFGLSRIEIALLVTWPAVMPAWIAALRTGLGLGFMFVVAAELMGASEGLGYLLLDGEQMGRADEILVAMFVFAVLGKAADSVLVSAARPVLRWQDTHRLRL